MCTYVNAFLFALIALFLGLSIGITISDHSYESNFDSRSVEKGYAEYNSTTGKLEYLDKDVKYLLYGEE